MNGVEHSVNVVALVVFKHCVRQQFPFPVSYWPARNAGTAGDQHYIIYSLKSEAQYHKIYLPHRLS